MLEWRAGTMGKTDVACLYEEVPSILIYKYLLVLCNPARIAAKRFACSFVAPRTQPEQILAQIWAAVLGLEQVSVTDNFFALGGDSILSMQIIARAAQANIRLTPRQIFQQQTIEVVN